MKTNPKELVWSRWTHIIILVYHCIHKNNKDTLQHCNAGMQVKNSVDKFIQILDKNTIGVIHHIDNSEVWHAGTLYDQNQGMKRSAHWLLTKKARKCNPATLTGCGKWPASRVRSIYYFCPAIFDVCESPWNKSYCLRSMETKKTHTNLTVYDASLHSHPRCSTRIWNGNISSSWTSLTETRKKCLSCDPEN